MTRPKTRTWELWSYGFVLVLSLFMLAATVIFVFLHCRLVLAADSIPGTCGVGIGWVLVSLAFVAIAGYAGWQLYGMVKGAG
jgi:uncharacterized BrkB/YihY/UPF0761 family membrane protein